MNETLTHEPEPVAQPDLWTSESQRVEEQAETTQVASDEPVAVPAKDEPAVVTARDEAGQFVKGKGKPRTDPQARVEAATAKEAAAKEDARLAREETSRLRAELETARRPTVQEKPTPAVKGEKFATFEQWLGDHPEDSYEDYTDARAASLIERRMSDARREQADQARRQTYGQRSQAASAKYTDFQAVVTQDLPLSLVMQDAILDSDQGPDIAYWLGTHPELCRQLAEESKDDPVAAVRSMRRYLETQVTTSAVATPDSAPVVRPSTAKPPINRVGGTANATPADPDDLEFGPEFIRLENAREKKRQEAGRW